MRLMTNSWTIDSELLTRGAQLTQEYALVSPLVPAPWLGANVWAKLELAQPTKSFKVRGALVRLSALDDEARKKGVIAASAGNHGLGLAWAGKTLGVPVTIYVPSVAPDVKVNGMRELGARVEVCEETGFDAVKVIADAAAADAGLPMVSAFDDPMIAGGNGGTLALELFEALPGLKNIVVPIGGGGLVSGIVAACESAEKDVRLIGIESDASNAMGLSVQDGRTRETLEAKSATLAEGLEGGVCESTHAAVKRGSVFAAAVSEEEIAQAIVFASKHLGTPVEGSAAVVVAWMRRLENQNELEGPTVVVITGGNIDQARVQALAAGWRPGRTTAIGSEPADVSFDQSASDASDE